MKNKYIEFFSKYSVLIMLLLPLSCTDEPMQKPESNHKPLIQKLLASEKLSATEDDIAKIELFEQSLNFRNISFATLSSGSHLYVVDIKSSSSEREIRKAIFIVGKGILLTIRIVAFDNSGNLNYANLVATMIDNKVHSYTGRMSVFSIYDDLVFSNTYEKGRLKSNAAALPGTEPDENAKTDGCTAWFLVTTTYYANGTTSQTSEYIGTTCDCFENTTRSAGRIGCGGGGGGGSQEGSGLPNNPQQGDIEFITLNNGVTRILQFVCNDYGCNWTIIGTTLPMHVVTANRSQYYFLPLNAYANQIKIGPDRMKYTYNANWMEWSGTAMAGDDDDEILEQFLAANPFALLDIPCDQVASWIALAQNQVSQTVKNKINTLQNANSSFDDWAIQSLNGANGTVVNMDYFSVNIPMLPKNPVTGVQFSSQGLLDHFRKNISSFVEGSTFSPYCETQTLCTQETALWNSSNPLGSIIYIDIPVDDGAVVCSEYTPSYWKFTTLEAPGAGNHPVSGTREFGITQQPNGTFTLYIRGVDRFDSNIMENTSYMAQAGEPFLGSDLLWNSFQYKMTQFVNANEGMAYVNPEKIYRPDWDLVREVVNGTKPITDLGCN